MHGWLHPLDKQGFSTFYSCSPSLDIIPLQSATSLYDMTSDGFVDMITDRNPLRPVLDYSRAQAWSSLLLGLNTDRESEFL
jgi:hypothetical protein